MTLLRTLEKPHRKDWLKRLGRFEIYSPTLKSCPSRISEIPCCGNHVVVILLGLFLHPGQFPR